MQAQTQEVSAEKATTPRYDTIVIRGASAQSIPNELHGGEVVAWCLGHELAAIDALEEFVDDLAAGNCNQHNNLTTEAAAALNLMRRRRAIGWAADEPASVGDAQEQLQVSEALMKQEPSWTRAKPTQPGAYWIRGNQLMEPALVQVKNDGGQLWCNLHISTTEPDFGYGYSIAQLSDQFEWIGPLGSAPAFQAYEPPVGKNDPLYQDALQAVVSSQRASASMVQRRLGIGYNRAARMVEAMEAAGIVSGMNSDGACAVLVLEVPNE